jgi:hypothetical protein
MQDRMALYRFMSHGNVAVRLYATEKSELLDSMERFTIGPDKGGFVSARAFPRAIPQSLPKTVT